MSTNTFKPIHRSESETKAQAAPSIAGTDLIEATPQMSALSGRLEPSISPTAAGTESEAVSAVIAELFGIKAFSFTPPSANPKRYEQDDPGMGYLFADNFRHLLRYM